MKETILMNPVEKAERQINKLHRIGNEFTLRYEITEGKKFRVIAYDSYDNRIYTSMEYKTTQYNFIYTTTMIFSKFAENTSLPANWVIEMMLSNVLKEGLSVQEAMTKGRRVQYLHNAITSGE